MSAPVLTPAQQRALDWLPRNGTFRAKDRASIISDMSAFRKGFPGCSHAEKRWSFSAVKFLYRYQLTPLGIATFYPEKAT